MAIRRTHLGINGVLVLAGLLQLLLHEAAQLCPTMCQFCSVDMVECEHISSLQEVLGGLSTSTERIRLRNGNLTEIPPLAFENFASLRFLSLTGFLMSSLTDLAFFTAQVNSLRSLDLSHNHLLTCRIEPMAFAGLGSLEELILTNNTLDAVKKSWFFEMTGLHRLFLTDNRITYLPPKTFESLGKLDHLIVSSNRIQYLSMDTFYGLTSLTTLDVSSNEILFIHMEALQPLQALKYLLLFKNRLTVLPILPVSVNFLFLHENPWDCNCQLANSIKSFTDKVQTTQGAVCDKPPSLAGRRMTDTKPEGCPSLSSNIPPQTILNLRLLFGFLGGFLICLIIFLIIICCSNCIQINWQAEKKQPLLNQFARAFSKGASLSDPRVVCSFPVIEVAAMDFEAGNLARGTSVPLSGVSRSFDLEHMRSTVQRPLVALLSVDQVTGKRILTLCERGKEMRGPTPDPRLWQTTEGHGQRVTDTFESFGAHGTREPHFVKREHEFCSPHFRHASPNQMDRPECVLGRHFETHLHGLTSKPESPSLGGIPCPKAFVHIDFTTGSPMKIKRDGAMVCAASSERDDSQRSEFLFKDSHDQTELRKDTVLSGRPAFMPPGWDKALEERQWQEGTIDRRHLEDRSRSGRASWKTETCSKDFPSPTSKGSRKQLHIPTRAVTSISSLSSIPSQEGDNGVSSSTNPYVEMLPIAHHSRKKKSSSQIFGNGPQMRKIGLERRTHRSRREHPNHSLLRNVSVVKQFLRCRMCGWEKLYPAKGMLLKAAPRSSRRLLDVTSHGPSSNTSHPKEKEAISLSFLGQHHNAENLRPVELWKSHYLPRLSAEMSHFGQNEDDLESIDAAPSQPFIAKATSEKRHLDQASGTSVPLTENEKPASPPQKSSEQLSLKYQEEVGNAIGKLQTETTVNGSTDMHSPKRVSGRALGEEMENAEETPAGAVVEGELVEVGTSPNGQHLGPTSHNVSACLLFTADEKAPLLELVSSEWSDSKESSPVLPEAQYQEDANITSSCPLRQKMCQIDFPLLIDEEQSSTLWDQVDNVATLCPHERTVWETRGGNLR